MDTTSTKDRLEQYIAYKRLSKRRFQASIGVSSGWFQGVTSKMSASVLQRISSIYPDLNTDWLLTGEGEMLNRTDTPVNLNYSAHGPNSGINNVQSFSPELTLRLLDELTAFRQALERLLTLYENQLTK